jgi:hypothetical protein
MMPRPSNDWLESNQRYLSAALGVVRAELEKHSVRGEEHLGADAEPASPPEKVSVDLREAAAAMPGPPALEGLCALFGLSPFERHVVLLCAGIELDSGFARLCAAAHGDPVKAYPTFSLALAVLPDAHWSALSPAAPLRRWRLIELGGGHAVTTSPLRIDERVLHYLTGIHHVDERLAGYVEPLQPAEDLTPSHQALAERIADVFARAPRDQRLPVVQLCGDDRATQRAVAAAACALLGLDVHVIQTQALPLDPRELAALLRLWWREAALSGTGLLLDGTEADASDLARQGVVSRVIEAATGILILTGRERHTGSNRPLITLGVSKPSAIEQRSLWMEALGPASARMNGRLDNLVAQFSLSPGAIRAVCAEAAGHAAEPSDAAASTADLGDVVWTICRVQTQPQLENLAQRIEPVATWDDLVLPPPQRQILREMNAQARHRLTVYESWGFAHKCACGLGISALFVGASGTGKTMAAEVLANELRLDLYRIDLSQVVSKYIGETEKSLRRVFDAAEDGGAILLFDEADALFGKRSDVKDSHDRYANIEVSYLLQRMEVYRGLAILTTNMKEALDAAFLRRIRFVVQFPFPDADQRAEIWRRTFPAATPTDGLNISKLARLNIAGGTIRNMALYAAFLAADAGEPVGMSHLLRAARVEYAKLERPLTDTEIGGWA